MSNYKIIDIEAEFEGIEFDEKEINRLTGITRRYQNITEKEKQTIAKAISHAKKGKESNHKGKSRPWAGKPRENKSVEKHTQETKIKISNTKANKSQEEKQVISKNISSAKKGTSPWNKGKPCSDETKRKISETKSKNSRIICKPIQTPLGIYINFNAAVLAHMHAGMTKVKKKLGLYLRNNEPGYRRLSMEEYNILISNTSKN